MTVKPVSLRFQELTALFAHASTMVRAQSDEQAELIKEKNSQYVDHQY
jgi:hypothetical protein